MVIKFIVYRLWYWELVETVNRLTLTGILVVIEQGTTIQIIFGLVFTLFFTKMYILYDPFKDHTIGTLKEIVQWQILCVLFIALLLRTDVVSNENINMTVILIFFTFANILYEIIIFAIYIYGIGTAKSSKINDEAKVDSNGSGSLSLDVIESEILQMQERLSALISLKNSATKDELQGQRDSQFEMIETNDKTTFSPML